MNRALKRELGFTPLGLDDRVVEHRTASLSKTADTKTSRKRKRDEDSGSEDEVSTFKARPSAVVNRPMVIPPVDKKRKQAIELSMAQADPNASFAERVAQFDTMEALAKKRMCS
jgi:hypothetical protein